MIRWEKITDQELGVYYVAEFPFLPSWDADNHGDAFLTVEEKKGGWYLDEQIDDGNRKPRRWPKLKRGPYKTMQEASDAAEDWIYKWCPRLFGGVVVRRLKDGIAIGENWDTDRASLSRKQAVALAHWILGAAK